MNFDKPVVVIYNPNSGKKTNLVPNIEARLNKAGIKFEMMPTKKACDPYLYALEIDIEKYSVIVVAGGDGTIHEVVNGVLARRDGKKIPICAVPNGSGDDFCSSIGVKSVPDALDYLEKGLVIKLDTVRCMLDIDDEVSVPQGLERLQFCRHMIVNSCFSMPCKIT